MYEKFDPHADGGVNRTTWQLANSCQRTKLRGNLKTLVTKDLRVTLFPAWLMPQGMVILLEMKQTEMGNRGSKSDKYNRL